jgi:hypothetical protein
MKRKSFRRRNENEKDTIALARGSARCPAETAKGEKETEMRKTLLAIAAVAVLASSSAAWADADWSLYDGTDAVATGAQASDSTAHIDHAQDANWAATMSRIVKLSMAQNGGNVSRTRVCEPSRKTCTSSVNYFNTDGIYAFLAVIRDSNGRLVKRSACHLNKEADLLSCTDFDTSEKTVSRKNGSGDWTSIADNNAKPPAHADPKGNYSVMYGNTPQPSLQPPEGERKKALDSYASMLAIESPDGQLGANLRHCDAQWHRDKILKDWVDEETCRRKEAVEANNSTRRELDNVLPPPTPNELAYVRQEMRGFFADPKNRAFYEASKYSDDCVLDRVANTYGWRGSLDAVHEIGAYCSKAVKVRFPGLDDKDLSVDALSIELNADKLFPCRALHPGSQEMICNPTPEQDRKYEEEDAKEEAKLFGPSCDKANLRLGTMISTIADKCDNASLVERVNLIRASHRPTGCMDGDVFASVAGSLSGVDETIAKFGLDQLCRELDIFMTQVETTGTFVTPDMASKLVPNNH